MANKPTAHADADLTVEIEGLGARADGIAHDEGRTIYVPYTVPGDRVRIRTEAGPGRTLRGEVREFLAHGAGRVDPVCRHFGRCGGCSLQMLEAGAYRQWLVERIGSALAHHGFSDVPVDPPVVSPPNSRRRMVLQARQAQTPDGAPVLGFHEAGSKRLVDVAECPVSDGRLVALLAPLRALLARLLKPRQAARVTATLAGNGVDVLMDLPALPDLDQREALAAFARDHDLAALHVSDGHDTDPVAITRTPVVHFDGVAVPLPPGAFIQATAEGEAALTAFVLEEAGAAARVADLFAGLGTFAIALTRQARVLAVEGAGALAHGLEQAGRHLSGRHELAVAHRDLFRRPLRAAELDDVGAVVFDPPRAGAKAQCAELADSRVPRVIAVSCNPNTFARDARILVDGGYRLERTMPVGQFLWSHHVELAASFVRDAT